MFLPHTFVFINIETVIEILSMQIFTSYSFTSQIHPDLRELMETMNRMSILPANFEGRSKVQKWWVHIKRKKKNNLCTFSCLHIKLV